MQNLFIKAPRFCVASILLLLGYNHALAFDPNAVLQQQREQQETQQKATKVTKEQPLYKQYRNKAEVHINDDGKVTIGRLQWMRCSLGQLWDGKACLGEPSSLKLDDANALPGLMNAQGGFAGYTDWRSPKIGNIAFGLECLSRGSSVSRATVKLGDMPRRTACSGACFSIRRNQC